jgi:DNA modification methylase
VPCIVLDPFSGAATTGLVARELGRHYIGLELSGEYLKQSRERLGLAALDAWKGGNGNEKATSLEGLPMFVERSEP